ncbi:hypothetical protein [Bacillus sp. D386]|uniref:hypothetical protein n=1 Tax=Bacillus sp. D386 TaxID=2587155 RepID=UPI0011212BE9|nr:hypothetical protein [Bacillus sp. D386]
MNNRKKVSDEIENELFFKSKRRCCICYWLDNDLEEKQGQIAHLDKNKNNNNIDNLAFLCLPHHDKYDTRTSQSKNYTKSEVKKYRELLYEYWEVQSKVINKENYQTYLQDTINLKNENQIINNDTIIFKVSDLDIAEPQYVMLELWNEGKYEVIINKIIMENRIPFHYSANDWEIAPTKGVDNSNILSVIRYKYRHINDFELEVQKYIYLKYMFPKIRVNAEQLYSFQFDFRIEVTIPSKEFQYNIPDIKREIVKTIFFKHETGD